MVTIIISILLTIISPIVLCIIVENKSRQKEKNNDSCVVLKIPKKATIAAIFLYIIGLLASFAQILSDYYYVNDGYNIFDTISTLDIIVSIATFFAFFWFVYSRYNYYVLYDDKIIKRSIIRKDINYNLNDIAYYKTTNKYGLKVSVYDVNGILMFSINSLFENVNKFIDVLNINNIPVVPDFFPTDEMKKTEKYLSFQKSLRFKNNCIILFLLICACFILCTLNLPISKMKAYENFEVNGIVERYSFASNSFRIKLFDNNNEYYIDDIVVSVVDKELKNIDLENKNIDLLIGYKAKDGRFHISQIKYDGKIYLDKDTAWESECNNYNFQRLVGYAFLGVGLILSIFLIKNVIRYNKEKEYLLKK